MSDIPVNTLETAKAAVDADAPPVQSERGTSLVRSVSSNWLWYMLVILSGFLIPPLVNRKLGRQMLGIWDFGWALVFYVNWLQVGVTGAINRYVARHRAISDWEGLNKTVNSCLALLMMTFSLGTVVILLLTWAAPHLLTGLNPGMMRTGRYVVLLLGFTTLLEIASSAFNSVISGCERFDVLNLIRGTRDGLVLVVIIAVLLAGGGLVTMAVVMLVTEALQAAAFLLAGRRLCPQIRFSPKYCDRKVMRETLSFGAKTVSHGFARGILFEINSVMMTWFLGPGMLAVFARQMSLVFSLFAFVRHYAYVLVPRTSTIQARGDEQALQNLVIASSRFGFFITLPAILIFVTMGAPLLRFWMGPAYEAPLVLAICAIGNCPVIAQTTTYSIMMGMSRHGRLVYYSLGSAALSVMLGFVGLKLGLGILGPALAISLAMFISDGILQPLYACRQLHLSYRRYLAEVLPAPLAACLPFAASLIAARLLVHASPWLTILAGIFPGGCILLVIYWFVVVPESLRAEIRARLRMLSSRGLPMPVGTAAGRRDEVNT